MGIIWSCWKKPDVLYALYLKIVTTFFIFFLYFFNNMAKSLSRWSRRKDSPFKKQQRIFITKHASFYNTTVLCRLFILKFHLTNKHLIPKQWAFQRLVNRFEEGDVWAALVGDSILRIRWMDKAHRPPIVTGASYLAIAKEEVWPEVRGPASQRRWWWQQDGTGVHCTNAVINFLDAKFHSRVISDQTQGRASVAAFQPRSIAAWYISGVLPTTRCGDRSQQRPWWKKWQPLSTATFFIPSWQFFWKRTVTWVTMEGCQFEYALYPFNYLSLYKKRQWIYSLLRY